LRVKIEIKKIITETTQNILVLCAGMPRSGSTWLYNAARLIFLNSDLTHDITNYGWVGDLYALERKRRMIVKIHDYSDKLCRLEVPKIVLYSYRDLRDALASAKRKWGQNPSIELADHYIKNDIKWQKNSDFIMRYEEMIKNPHAILSRLSDFLSLPGIDVTKIISQINDLSYEGPGKKNQTYNMINLLHKGHITDGRHGTWENFIDKELAEQIMEKYRDWFAQNNY
jgi:hypothetical protein